MDETGLPIAESGHLAPVVIAEKCVGCGLCQTRCYGINVVEKKLLKESAIIIKAGEGREDRLMSGSYIQLRKDEQARKLEPTKNEVVEEGDIEPFAPDEHANENPFGL